MKPLMVTKRSGGFTLVELTIVLAITAGLLVIALNGQATLRGQSRFRDSVEQTAAKMDEIRNQALTSLNDGTGATGTNTSTIVFGKRVTFTSGSSQVVVTDILGTKANQLSDDGTQTLTSLGANTYTYSMPWGITYNGGGTNQEFVFHRLLIGGKLHLYPLLPTGNTISSYTFSESPATDPTITIPVIDDAGRKANIILDGTHEGAVSRVYL